MHGHMNIKLGSMLNNFFLTQNKATNNHLNFDRLLVEHTVHLRVCDINHVFVE
jgi:hypothetical protein